MNLRIVKTTHINRAVPRYSIDIHHLCHGLVGKAFDFRYIWYLEFRYMSAMNISRGTHAGVEVSQRVGGVLDNLIPFLLH